MSWRPYKYRSDLGSTDFPVFSDAVGQLTVDFERGAVVFGRPLEVDYEEPGPLVRRPVHTPEAAVLP